jgi:hypothetical protein
MSQAVGTEEVPWRSPPLASGAQISDIENSSSKRLAPKFVAFGGSDFDGPRKAQL